MGLWHLYGISRVDWVSDPFLTHPLGGSGLWREVGGPCGTESSATDASRRGPFVQPLRGGGQPARKVPNLFAFLFKIGQNLFQLSQNGSKWVPKGSKCGQKRVNLYQNALNWVPSGLKWHQHASRVEMGQNRLQWGPTRPKGVKMASKWPQIPQNGLFQAKFA